GEEEDDEQRDEDLRESGDAVLHAHEEDAEDDDPDDDERDEHPGHELEGDARIAHLEVFAEEESLGVVSPGLTEREEHVRTGPADDRGIVDADDDRHTGGEPADGFGRL